MRTVVWHIELDADSDIDAASRAREIMLDPESAATVFTVLDPELGTAVRLDLEESRPEVRPLCLRELSPAEVDLNCVSDHCDGCGQSMPECICDEPCPTCGQAHADCICGESEFRANWARLGMPGRIVEEDHEHDIALVEDASRKRSSLYRTASAWVFVLFSDGHGRTPDGAAEILAQLAARGAFTEALLPHPAEA